MKSKTNFLKRYLELAPAALALERSLECELLSKQKFVPPILDIGCGDGIFAYVLSKKIDLGIDPDSKELEICHQLGIYKKIICCFGDNIPQKNQSFNTIFSNSVMEHIQNIEPVLLECHRLLTSNGRLFITVPNHNFSKYTIIYQLLFNLGFHKFSDAYRIKFDKFWKHYHAYSQESWSKIFIRNGYKVVNITPYNSKAQCIFHDAMVPCAIPTYFNKKITNRWFLFPSLRSAVSRMLFPLLEWIDQRLSKFNKEHGLLFFELKKKY